MTTATISTGLNPRAVEVQAPACADEESGRSDSAPMPAQAGICFTEARGFSPVERVTR